jgi:hypothetical protein
MEQLLLLVLFLLVVFAGSLARWLKARMEASRPAETRPPDGDAVRRPQRLLGEPAVPARTPPVTYAQPSPPPPVETQRRSPQPRLGGPSDLRRAIVLMAVLGPCRALEREEPSPQR